MRWLKIGAGVVVAGLALLGVGAGGAWVWAGGQVESTFAKTWETHDVDFPVPYPLTEAEISALREQKKAELAAAAAAAAAADPAAAAAIPAAAPAAEGAEAPPEPDPLEGVDLGAIALQRAQERGKHYVEAIYVCVACHGVDFGGGKMIEDPAIGTIRGPNITSGGKTANYTPRDWDRAVRHGVLTDGKTSIMPVADFASLTDRELSDIVAYIRSVPPKDGGPTVREFGPVGRFLVATGKLVPDVYAVPDHQAAHAVEPPPVGETVEYGKQVTSVCVGCHRSDLRGGPMPFGPPDWPPAANLTPHESGLAGYSYEDWVNSFQKGVRKDGSAIRAPMSEMLPVTANWTETELKAAWMYLQSLPPTPQGT